MIGTNERLGGAKNYLKTVATYIGPACLLCSMHGEADGVPVGDGQPQLVEDRVDDRLPASEIGRRRVDPEVVPEDEVIDALLVEGKRAAVDIRHVVRRDDRVHRQAREQRDLLANLRR